ncbi:MAG: RluA family pseudouridine synthase [Candidatus Moranbacteria bacterium]|nr:RluA family pseudouridine synthase [Candidatus Moranbacteria bacterium]NTW75352.1 RluA family pseudouridine synthase [Candidatus Moranbacteria bacterium]
MTEIVELSKTVQEISSGKRLDAFLSGFTRLEGLSRSDTRFGIESGFVMVNGKVETTPTKRLRYGDVVISTIPKPTELALFPNHDLRIPVIFESEHLLIISKPAGVQMHPAGRDTVGTVANWVAANHPEMTNIGSDPLRPGIVHRLDRNTSGIVVLAKSKEAFETLQDLFRDRKTEKTYLALVIGHVRETTGNIDFPLAQRTGTLRRQAVRDPEHFSGEMKEAHTEYRLQKRFGADDLLEVFPKTGRTHQIRIHLAAIGHPVLGDNLYGGRRMRKNGMPDRQLLHAWRIAFPFQGEIMTFESPLPSDFTDFLAGIDVAEKLGYPVEDSNGPKWA